MSKSAELKCTWTNCLIWAFTSPILGAAFRGLAWYFVVYLGDANIYFDEFCYGIIWMLLPSIAFPVICNIPAYRGYMKLADAYKGDLPGVAHGRHGKPWILPLIIMLILDVAWLVISSLNVLSGYVLNLSMEADKICFLTYVGLAAGGILFNIVLFWLGIRFFQPNLVRNSR